MADVFFIWQYFPALASLLPPKTQCIVANKWAEMHASLVMSPHKGANRKLPHLLLSQTLHFTFFPWNNQCHLFF